MSEHILLKTFLAFSLLSSCRSSPTEGTVMLNKALSGRSTANKDCTIEPETPATLYIRPTIRNIVPGQLFTEPNLEIQEFITQLQLIEGESEICTVEPPGTLLNHEPLNFPRRAFEFVQETHPQAQITPRFIPRRLPPR